MQENLFGSPIDKTMQDIRSAASKQRTMILMYRDSKGSISQREIEPYEIKNEGIYGYCYIKDSIRFFKLANILDTKVTNKTFIPRWPMLIE